MKLVLALLAAMSLLSAADIKLGKPLTAETQVPIATLVAHPDEYVRKTVQVKGKIAEVCQETGCWIDLVDGGKKIRIKVNDKVIQFPKDGAGKTAIAEGRFHKVELTRDQAVAEAQQEAKEQHRKFDPATIKTGTSYYQIRGTGAVILWN